MGFATETASGAGDFAAILPEILIVLWGTAVLVADLVSKGGIKRKTLGWLAGLGMLFILAVTWVLRPGEGQPNLAFGGMIRSDMWTWAFRLIFTLGAALTCIASIDFRPAKAGGEFYALVILAAMAMSLMAASNDIIILYLATETASIALYLLAGSMRGSKLSAEAGIKYFVFGAVASTVMLYGLSLLFGLSGGNTGYEAIAATLRTTSEGPMALIRTPAVFASLLVLVGFAFKTSAVPLHFWAPDVYQGAPTPIAGFISTASKAAGFAIMLRFLFYVLPPGESFAADAWISLLRPFALMTLLVGSLAALMQTNVKRMLAYSSVAQAGYLLMGVAAFGASPSSVAREEALAAILFYVATYMLTNIGAFTVVGAVSQKTGGDDFKDFAGIARRSPYLALAMTAAILSLLGAPPLVGFMGKLFLFRSAIGAYQATGDILMLAIVIVGVVMVLVSVFYYLGVVKAMFVDRTENDGKAMYVPGATSVAALLTGVGVIVTTLLSGPLFEVAMGAARSFLTVGQAAQSMLR
jgi:NADH-quinone oxidoreductase subunit N